MMIAITNKKPSPDSSGNPFATVAQRKSQKIATYSGKQLLISPSSKRQKESKSHLSIWLTNLKLQIVLHRQNYIARLHHILRSSRKELRKTIIVKRCRIEQIGC